MHERKRVSFLILIMVVISAFVAMITITLLYQAALEEQRDRLVETAQSQARLIEAIARHDAIYEQGTPGGAEAATMSQLIDAHENYKGFGETGEFTLARREGDSIVFLLSHRHYDLTYPKPVPFDSELAEPMRQALSGNSGALVGLDYRGEKVLAAYEPVAVLDLGIVAKIDLAEIQAPFVRAGIIAGGATILVILLGAYLFIRISNPIIRHLRESEESYRAIFTQARDGIVLVDGETGLIINCNPEFESQTGRQLEQLKKMTIWQVRPPEKIEAAQKTFFEIRGEGMGGSSELEFQKPDGEIVFIEFVAATITIQGKKCLQSISRDITERKLAEEDIRKLSHAVEQSPGTIIITDAKGDIEYVNTKFTKISGYTREEVIGKNLRFLKSGKTSPEEYEELWRTITSGNEWRGELLNKRKDGELYWELATIAPIKNSDGVITHFIAVKEDITERRQLEEDLKKSEQGLKEAQTLGQIGSWEFDVEKQTIIWSEETYVLYERDLKFGPPSPEEEARYYSPEQAKTLTDYAARAIATGRTFSYDLKVILPSGKTPYYHAVIHPIKDPQGRVVNLSGTIQDITERKLMEDLEKEKVRLETEITERKKVEEQLMVTDRLASIGELSSGIAHELNNPLTSIIGFSELLLDKDIPDDIKEDLEVINREAKRTVQIVGNLLTFARKHAPSKQPVDINSAIQKVLELRAYEQKINNIQVNTQFAADLPEITADGFQLQQVFLNIIINAEHFMIEAHNGGTLTITTERAGDIIRVSFADDGSGIAKENLGHIFDPFFTTKEVGKGTGLGLSISYGIITEHGGRIYAESELGKGATLAVELPISQ